jgi:hypothetical protein
MNHRVWSAVVLLVSAASYGQEADAGPSTEVAHAGSLSDLPQQFPDAGTADSALANEIDAAAGQALPNAAKPVPEVNPVVRAFQSLNPDLAVIADFAAGIGRETTYSLAGDDPDLMGGPGNQPAGFAVQEVEVAFQAVVDPYLRADVYLAIPNLSGVEVEEAVATSTSLPAGFQVRAGIFRSAFGRQNGQHLHLQDFTRRPLINEAYLGADGLRSPGLQVSWLAPTPFFLQLSAEAFSVAPPEDLAHLTTFGGGKRTDLTYTGGLKTFFPVTDSVSVLFGANFGVGKTAGIGTDVEGEVLHKDRTSVLESFDLYVKFKPSNQAGSYFSVAWQTEVFVRQLPYRPLVYESLKGFCDAPETAPGSVEDLLPYCEQAQVLDAGMYSQVVVQVARRWFVGLRQDLLGLVTSDVQPRVNRTSLSVTFTASEFARIRAYVERESLPSPTQVFFDGRPNWAGYLQLELSIGAHGGHPF